MIDTAKFCRKIPDFFNAMFAYIFCYIDPLIGKDLETNNERVVVAMQ
jgi:hypothetical protein